MDIGDLVQAGCETGGMLAAYWCGRHDAKEDERGRRDPMTGVWTRAAWTHRALKLVKKHKVCTVVFMDVDYLKFINDMHGHAAGDTSIRTYANRLDVWGRLWGGVTGRFGGDEFVLIVPEDLSAEMTQSLEGMLYANPVRWNGEEWAWGASYGAAVTKVGDSEKALSQALAEADELMYAAKGLGEDRRRGKLGVNSQEMAKKE